MTVATQVIVLFLLIVVGVFARKTNIVTEKMNNEIGSLIMKITLPAFIITSMSYEFSYETLMESMNLIVISFAVYAVAIAISFLMVKIMKTDIKKADVYQYVITFSNTGYMGYPVVAIVFGELGVFYAAIYNLSFNILIWTYGVYLMRRHHEDVAKPSPAQRLKEVANPGLVAVIIGFGLFLTSTRLPEPIFKAMELIGGTTTPLSMMFIGFLLSELKFKELFNSIQDFIVIAVRLLLMPILVYIVLKSIGLTGMTLGIPVLITAMPAAANSAVFSSLYHNNSVLASKLIFISTLFSVMTIPLFIVLLN